jgi:hypothetical protein
MAERNRVELEVNANTRGAQAAMASFGDWLKTGFGIDIAGRLTSAFAQLPQMLERALKVGVQFNSTLEDAELGFAGLMRAIDPDRFKSLDDALNGSRKVIKELRKEAESTAATFEQLVEATQGLMGPALSAGVPLEKLPQLSSMIARTVGTVMPGAPGYQIMQEGRALITGDIGPSAMVAKSIPGITKQGIEEAKASGKLFEYLQDKLGAFNEAAGRSGQTLTVLTSNLQDAFQGQMADATTGLFASLKDFVRMLTDLVKSDAFSETMSNLAAGASLVVGGGTEAAPGLMYYFNRFTENLSDELASASSGFTGLMDFGLKRSMSAKDMEDYLAKDRDVAKEARKDLRQRAAAEADSAKIPPPSKKAAIPAPRDPDKLYAALLKDTSFAAPKSSLASAGLYLTQAQAILSRQSLNLQTTMARELTSIREFLIRSKFEVTW